MKKLLHAQPIPAAASASNTDEPRVAHTAEPWLLETWKRDIFVYGGPNNDEIAEFCFSDEHTVAITREEAVANAQLFFAAPDMLAALKLAEELYQTGVFFTPPEIYERVHAARRAAIAKAEGRS